VLATDLDSEIRRLVDEVRSSRPAAEDDQELSTIEEADREFAIALSELRLIKDAFEIAQMREACRQTALAFEAVVAAMPEAVRRGRGERWIEGIVGLHARHAGNAVGYDTIAAAGDHACTLHWIRNDGDLHEDELLLLDAGIELDSLYTADITRTLPISGRFSNEQRMVYDAVYEAQQAGLAAARPGVKFGTLTPGDCCRSAWRNRSASKVDSIDVGWCMGRRIISASTCMTVRRPGRRTIGKAFCSRA
jgi:Xaa-Pro aminopeptidase